MQRAEIETHLRAVGAELANQGLIGEIVLAGGAFMTLVLRSREATLDVDAYFDPKTSGAIRAAALKVARQNGLPDDWLNDAVKGFFATPPLTTRWAEYPGLRVDALTPAYMLAMKAVAGRPQDLSDIEVLARHLGVTSSEGALAIVIEHVPERLLTPRVRYLLEELFDKDEP
jgi:predicted nucleotidyltransferase